MKLLFVVSTGRCGTKRLAEILNEYTNETYIVNHQVKWSRISNIIGNILLQYKIKGESLKKWLIKRIIPQKSDVNFITTDPLVSLIIPEYLINSNNVAIIHIVRDKKSFGKSFYQFTRKKIFSFIAHNFIPFWQPNVYLFENIIRGVQMVSKYEKVSEIKTIRFKELYSQNPNYKQFKMEDIFEGTKVIDFIENFFHEEILIPDHEFKRKSNQSI